VSNKELLRAVDGAASGLIPELTARLARHGLGEIEVRSGELRVRVVAHGAPVATSSAVRHEVAEAKPSSRKSAPSAWPTPTHSGPAHDPQGVTSPGVGYFAYADGLGPGITVEKGDPLGYVDVLGVRHDVRAPRSGVVRNLVTEAGEAVEYGQVLIELEAAAS
jgi:acetyl-CoA carboxylase biotin carboxyl carrier protein